VRDIWDRCKPDELRGTCDLRAIIPLEKDEGMKKFFRDSTIFVGEAEAGIVGFAGFKGDMITWLFVDPSHYRKGHGAALLSFILTQMGPTVRLNVGAGNHAAIRLYETHGFKIAEHFEGKNNGFPAKGVRMVRSTVFRNVIIIGPPASGKLTLAKALAKAKGCFLFDNHKSIDAVEAMIADQVVSPKDLCRAVRKAVFQAATASQTPTIFTMVYAYQIDDEVMKEYTAILTNSEPPLIVQLHCTRDDSIRRCEEVSRSGTSKITKPEQIEKVYTAFDLNSDYSPASKDVLHINTSTTSAAESVQRIIERI
jgi:GNAT superfamily N-acetyltransferase/shikimate kinase